MTSPIISVSERASRIKLLGTVLALVELENGTRVHARVNQISSNGGLLQLGEPLKEASAVRLMFHFDEITVRSRAEMLPPIWATKGCLQPFRFLGMNEEMRTDLAAHVSALLERSGNRQ